MTLIDRLSRWVSGSDSDADVEGVTYECGSCGSTFDDAYEECPECGSTEIRERGGPAGPDTEV